jgi:Ca-activated chloride channel family protein
VTLQCPDRRATRAVSTLGTTLMVLVTASVLAQQTPVPDTASSGTTPGATPSSESEATPTAPAREPRGPYEAYEQGQYDRALEGFIDQEVDHPDDPRVQMNIGSAHYKMRDFESAARSFDRALSEGEDPESRARALYNLGNTAYRQGKLPEAIDYYMESLDLNPEDEDAKFNLEFVRDEIRRRHEEAQKRQDQQQQQNPQPQDQQQQDDQQQQEQGEEEQQQQNESQPSDEQQSQGGQDSDQDGLPDEVEQSGQNPTDPQNPDTDGDGLPDGAEDLNRNGQLDPQETDPNNPDSDGDGVTDAEESSVGSAGPQGEPQEVEGLTPEEAERYLQALEEGRPERELPAGTKRSRNKKDW